MTLDEKIANALEQLRKVHADQAQLLLAQQHWQAELTSLVNRRRREQ